MIFTFPDEQSASNDDTEVVCENGVCYKRPKQNTAAPAEPKSQSESDQHSKDDEKLARAKELIEKKRKEKEEEDARVSFFLMNSVGMKFFIK